MFKKNRSEQIDLLCYDKLSITHIKQHIHDKLSLIYKAKREREGGLEGGKERWRKEGAFTKIALFEKSQILWVKPSKMNVTLQKDSVSCSLKQSKSFNHFYN